jgi:FPC/CPF motif-containing protein YcgG
MQNGTQSCSRLTSQHSIGESERAWHRDVLHNIESRLSGDPNFPCLFARNAFGRRLLRFVFVESISDADIRHLADGLVDYVELSRDWNGSLNTAYPLIVAFSLNAIRSRSAAQYDAFGWSILQRLHELDPRRWPIGVGTDANAATWSMCFNGMPLFCNMSHPAHWLRRSRNLGEHFVMVFNPRERFDVVAGDTPAGRNVRATIRARIERYDVMPHSPQLASYGTGGIEWWQYSLSDENIDRTDRCPFKFAQSGSKQ